MQDNNNIFARWLNNELTDAEKSQLKNSGDLEILEKIIAETDTWTLPEMSSNSYENLKEKIALRKSQTNETKIVPLKRNNLWLYGIAASVFLAIICTYFLFFMNNTVRYQSLAGQQLRVILPDQTVIILNGQSDISFNENSFLENRKVKLKGEGYFEVVKKGDFRVEFEKGEVKVLGTKFNILSGDEYAAVKCFEGKVMVSNQLKNEQIITPGKGVRINENQNELFEFTATSPDWIKGESTFDETPLIEVINALAIQYNIEFDINNVNTRRNYSGKFVFHNLDNALNMVFSPMGISYSIEKSDNKTKVTLNQPN